MKSAAVIYSSRPSLLTIATCALALSAPLSSEAVIFAGFDNGNGAASPDQWMGTAGNGWATPWQSGGSTTGTGVVTTSPLNGGGNYLQFIDDSVAATTTAFVRRQFDSSTGINLSQPYTLTLDFRFDGNAADFTSFGDRIAILGDPGQVAGTANSNTWIIGVAASNTGAGTGQSVFAGEWYFFDNNGSNTFSTANMFDTNLTFVPGRTYSITVDVDPAAGTYGASIDDGVNPVVSAEDLKFRSGATGSSASWVNVSVNSSTGVDSSAFSVDNVQLVPEPSVALTLLLGLGMLSSRRRR